MVREEINVMNTDDSIKYLLIFLVTTSTMNDIAMLTPIKRSITLAASELILTGINVSKKEKTIKASSTAIDIVNPSILKKKVILFWGPATTKCLLVFPFLKSK